MPLGEVGAAWRIWVHPFADVHTVFKQKVLLQSRFTLQPCPMLQGMQAPPQSTSVS